MRIVMCAAIAAVGLVGCKKGKPDREVKIVRFYGAGGPTFGLGAKLEVAGMMGSDMAVDLPITKAPKAGEMVDVVLDTPCGPKKIPVKLAPAKYSADGGPKPSDEDAFDFMYDFDVPDFPIPPTWHVVYDPALAGKVGLGTLAGDVKRGLPGGALVPPHDTMHSPATGSEIVALDCLHEVTINGKAVPIPPRDDKHRDAHTLFLTDRPDQCFEDRTVAYGDTGYGQPDPVKLTGQRAYWLDSEAPYSAFFAPISDTAAVGRGQTSTYAHSLNVCVAAK